MTSPDASIRPSFFYAAGGVHEPRWQQRGGRAATRTHARTGGQTARVVTPFSTRFCRGRLCAPHAGESSYFESDPLIRAATVQLSGTMTEDDGFCRRGGICQTPRWEKGP